MEEVELQGAAPDLDAAAGFAGFGLFDVDAAGEHSGDEDEAFGGRDEAEGLIDQVAHMRGEVGEHHPDEKEAAECVDFGLAFELGRHERQCYKDICARVGWRFVGRMHVSCLVRFRRRNGAELGDMFDWSGIDDG